MDHTSRICLVVPCFDEEQVLPGSMERLTKKMQSLIEGGLISDKSRILFVDDGSRDGTWQLIERAQQKERMVCGLKLSRNFGHQNAILAGMMEMKDKCDAVITLDADLQDDIEVLDAFIREFQKGSEIVYGVRSSRLVDHLFKRLSAEGFYRLMKKLGVELIYNHADYRLVSRRALEELEKYKEVNLFLRGIMPRLGFQTSIVRYERKERLAGKSKYPLKKMAALAVDGVTSFSSKPLSFLTVSGFLILTGSLLFMPAMKKENRSILMSIWAALGIQLVGAGILGEYIGKIYLETKGRPRFTVEKSVGDFL